MWKSFLIFSVLCCCGSLGHVMPSIYYESLCPDSMAFLVDQFYPVYLEHADHMMTQLVPFGIANATKENGTWKFECQHGDAECYGNKIHSCALELYPEEQSFAFIVCSMKSGNASLDTNLEPCATSSSITWTDLQDCITSGKADEYLAANGDLTKDIIAVSKAVPTIVFSGVYNEQLQKLSVIDFPDLVVFINDQVHCGFCQFTSGSKAVFASGTLVSGVTLLILAIQKLFV